MATSHSSNMNDQHLPKSALNPSVIEHALRKKTQNAIPIYTLKWHGEAYTEYYALVSNPYIYQNDQKFSISCTSNTL